MMRWALRKDFGNQTEWLISGWRSKLTSAWMPKFAYGCNRDEGITWTMNDSINEHFCDVQRMSADRGHWRGLRLRGVGISVRTYLMLPLLLGPMNKKIRIQNRNVDFKWFVTSKPKRSFIVAGRDDKSFDIPEWVVRSHAIGSLMDGVGTGQRLWPRNQKTSFFQSFDG